MLTGSNTSHARTHSTSRHDHLLTSMRACPHPCLAFPCQYGGWNGLNYATGLLEKPQYTLPRCIGFGVTSIVAIYLAVSMAYLGSLNPIVAAHSPVVAVALGERVLGRLGQLLIGVAISVACFGSLNSSILTGSQIYYRAVCRCG